MNIEIFKNHCCGCGECRAICPIDAITMQINTQGFYYPTVNLEKCVNCSKCVQHCSFNFSNNSQTKETTFAYAVKHTDETVRAASRSGGVFTALSDLIFDSNGVVYGCKLTNCREAVHTRATTKEERNKFRGSKYIQSITHNIFDSVKNDLKNGSWVLFSGTSCQVNAINDYCADVDCSKLLLVDIVCHGVPSPKVWGDYISFIEKANKKKITSVDFRDKVKFGWAAHVETFVFVDSSNYSNDLFKRLFYGHLILRKDCFECPYKTLNRISDITIADCWGIAEHYSDFDDNKGVSLVIINTNKGKNFFEHVKSIESIEVDINKLLQPALEINWHMPKEYDDFWNFYNKHSFKKVIDKFVFKKTSLYRRFKYFIKSNLARIYHKIVRNS